MGCGHRRLVVSVGSGRAVWVGREGVLAKAIAATFPAAREAAASLARRVCGWGGGSEASSLCFAPVPRRVARCTCVCWASARWSLVGPGCPRPVFVIVSGLVVRLYKRLVSLSAARFRCGLCRTPRLLVGRPDGDAVGPCRPHVPFPS